MPLIAFHFVLALESILLLGLGGLSFVYLPAILRWLIGSVFDCFDHRSAVNSELIIRQGGDLFDLWAEPPIQPLLKVLSRHHDTH